MERDVPWNESAEQSVLGAMLISPTTVIPIVTEHLTGSDFYRKSDGELFHSIVQMWLEDEASVDQITISAKYPEQRGYIFSLADSCPTASNARHYAALVKRDSTARALIQAGQEIVELGYTEDEESAKLIDRAEHKLTTLRVDRSKNVHRLGELGARVLRSIEAGESPRMVASGFATIDQHLRGLYEGNLILVGARPGIGKTCLGMSIAQRVATQGTVLYFSLEMKAEELYERLLASMACVSLTKIRERSTSENENATLNKGKEELDSCDLRIVDDTSITMLELCSKSRALAKTTDLKLIVVDYLQLMSMGGRVENRREEVSEMSRKLKSLAMELSTPVLALSQLNRVSTFDGTKPDISQLKESGSLEQDADAVLLMSWPKAVDMGTKTVTIDIAKNRHGTLGEVSLVWVPQYMRYEE
jgi:replicative DNA helicase